MDDKQLHRVQAYVSIAASIVVPVLIAGFGWSIQSRISTASVQKDYVQMAIGILSNKETKNDKELRAWAAEIIRKSSPVPFGKRVEASLAHGSITVMPPIPKELLATPMMVPPEEWRQLPNPETFSVEQLTGNYIENMRIAGENRAKLKYLQMAIHELSRSEAPVGENGRPKVDPSQAPRTP